MAAPEPSSQMQEATRLADLFSHVMSKTLSERLLTALPEARPLEITLPQLQALRFLWLHDAVLIGAFADGLDISYPSATNMVKRLEEKQLVCRQADPKDRRAVQVMLTEAGRVLTEKIENERMARFAAVLERMPEADRLALLQGLDSFVRLAVAHRPGTAGEICLRCGWRASATCPLAAIIPLFDCR